MKGLLIKDFRLLAGQKQFMGAVTLMCVIFSLMNDNPTFMICYMVIMFSVFTISTISYDGFDNGNAFLFTLPVSRKNYVKEKYVFMLLIFIAAVILITGVAEISVMIRHLEYTAEELVVSLMVSFLTTSWILGFSIPIQLKMGPEKSRIAMMAAMGAMFAILIVVVKVVENRGINLGKVLDQLVNGREWIMIAGGVAAGLLALLISYLLSVRIMEKKEF